jgi:hypothetical protein
MKIIDNSLPIVFEEYVKDILLGNNFPWFYQKDLTGGYRTEMQSRPAFGHYFVVDGQNNSDHVHLLNPIIEAVEARTNRKFSKILNARTFLQLPLSSKLIGKESIDTFHVDLEEEHFVILYYVLDSDGQTILSDRQYTSGNNVMMDINEDYKIIKKVRPKQGRILFFNGNIYHTALQPKKNVRCVLNINVL